MLTELESRLADVLGSRLPAPFAGRVRRRGAAAPAGSGPVVRLGVDRIEPLEPDFSSVRPEVVPGADTRRRVVRLGVTIGIDVLPQKADDRLQELLGVDAVVYEMQDPDMRSAKLLVQPGDQGFLLDGMELAAGDLVSDAGLAVRVEGWFWPVGRPGESGREIERALVREFRLPLQLELGGPLEAGAAGVALGLRFGATGTLDVAAGSTTTSPFGSVALRLLDDGGGPGAGTLTGGQNGPDATHLVAVTDGTAAVTYGPPAAPVVDHLVVSAYTQDADGDEHVGIELARFDLEVSS